MPRSAARQLLEGGLVVLVLVVTIGLLTPWGIAHRAVLEPRFAFVAIVFGTLSCAAFLVTGVSGALAGHEDPGAVAIPSCIAISSFLLVASFLWASHSPTAQNLTLAAAALFMISAAVLQLRARGRRNTL